MVIGIVIVRIQNDVWFNSTVVIMTVAALLVSGVMAIYGLSKNRPRSR